MDKLVQLHPAKMSEKERMRRSSKIRWAWIMSGSSSFRRVRSAAGALTSPTSGGQGFILDGLPTAQWDHRNNKFADDTHHEKGAHVYLKLATWNLALPVTPRRPDAMRSHPDREKASVWILTETHDGFSSGWQCFFSFVRC